MNGNGKSKLHRIEHLEGTDYFLVGDSGRHFVSWKRAELIVIVGWEHGQVPESRLEEEIQKHKPIRANAFHSYTGRIRKSGPSKYDIMMYYRINNL